MVTCVYLVGHFDTAAWSELLKVYRATFNNRTPYNNIIFYSNWVQMVDRRQVLTTLNSCRIANAMKYSSLPQVY